MREVEIVEVTAELAVRSSAFTRAEPPEGGTPNQFSLCGLSAGPANVWHATHFAFTSVRVNAALTHPPRFASCAS